MPVRFEVAKLAHEIELFERLTRDFLTSDAPNILTKLKKDLENGARSKRPFTLEIPQARPLQTVLSESLDGYEPNGRKCGLAVYGRISLIWELTPEPGKGGNTPAKTIKVTGLASTRISLLKAATDDTPEEEIARWRMEIASDGAPGCCFHVQVLGEESDFIFPHVLPIPRLPTPVMTPLMATEFVLGELFQDGWYRHATRLGNTDLMSWSSLQKKRLEQYFQWQQSQMKQNGSPLMQLKRAQPDANCPPF